MSKLYRMADYRPKTALTHFTRFELSQLLDVYGRCVAAGLWRDYAIDHRPGTAVFAVFRSTHEQPLFTITKRMVNGRDHRFVVTNGGRKLREGDSIAEVLPALTPGLRIVPPDRAVTPR